MPDQPLDLDAIEARETAATPGDWGYYDGGDYADIASDYQPTGPGSYTFAQSIARIEADEYEAEDDDEAADRMRADAEFITHARTDVPNLLAEIRRLTAERDRFRSPVQSAAVLLRSIADRADAGRPQDTAAIRAAATALDNTTTRHDA